MIEAKAARDRIRRSYDLYSYFYGRLAAPLERKARMIGLELAAIEPEDRVLEVAVGPGATFLQIVTRVDRSNVVHGVDLSPKMLERTRRLVAGAGYGNFELREADARDLPLPEASFDVLYNSYMLDLIPLDDMPIVLREFRRVLRPGGRLVLVNMSKERSDRRTWWERLYTRLPSAWVPYLMGGCRPVLMETPLREAGFSEVTRRFLGGAIPSEVLTARKPAGMT